MTIEASPASGSATLKQEIIETYGRDAWDLILTVYVNFYYSELEIIDLCARWLPRRASLREKNYLIAHASDEVQHARLFREGVEALGQPWHGFDHDAYKIDDIGDRFARLFYSDDEIEVLIGLNLYAEGVLAMEEIYQLGRSKSRYFHQFERIEREERRHVAFGITVANRILAENGEARKRAVGYTDWYREHLDGYLGGQLKESISWAIEAGFVSGDYIERTRTRFDDVMGKIGMQGS
jgi:1,2-phenylacetyl-CoA epoxidase catalytic subunit